jgi:hypothetical protein
MKLAKYLENNVTHYSSTVRLAKQVTCNSGLTMSIQASEGHYCSPRKTLPYSNYTAFEIGFPSEKVELFMPYVEDENNPTDTVYTHVPINVIEEVISKHGGIKEEKE